MGRPQSATDEEIIHAAHQVLVRRGHDAFTLSEVGDEVGLSRAAITLRFKSAEALKFRVINANVDRFLAFLDGLPKTPSGDNLIEIAAFLGRLIGHSVNSSPMTAVFSGNILSDDLAALEEKRIAALLAAIGRCMPETQIKHETACKAYLAHLSGALMAWQPREGDDPCDFLIDRAREWLALANIPFSDAYTGNWAHNPPTPPTSPGAPRKRRNTTNGSR